MERTLNITVDDISSMENLEKEALFKTLISEANDVIKKFKVGFRIKNNKTGKIGIVTRVYDEGINIVKYHLLGTPNNIHTIVGSEFDRFEVIKDKK